MVVLHHETGGMNAEIENGKNKLQASVRLEDGSTRSLPYEHISKLS